MERFHRSRAAQDAYGDDTPARYYRYGFDESALRRVLVEPFRMGGSTAFVTAVFDPARDAWIEPKWITGPADAILVLDGRFVLRERLADLWDFRIALDGSPRTRRTCSPTRRGTLGSWRRPWSTTTIPSIRGDGSSTAADLECGSEADRVEERDRGQELAGCLDLVHERGERRVHRGGHTRLGRLSHDDAVQEVDLGRLSAADALLGRAEVRDRAHARAHEPGQQLADGQRHPGEEAQAPRVDGQRLHGDRRRGRPAAAYARAQPADRGGRDHTDGDTRGSGDGRP